MACLRDAVASCRCAPRLLRQARFRMQRWPLTLSFLLLALGACAKPQPYVAPPQEPLPYRPTEHGGVSYEDYPDRPPPSQPQYDQNGYPIAQPQQTYGGLGTPPPTSGETPQQVPQEAPAVPGSRVEATGVASITKGDVVRAREQALAAAVRTAVEKSAGIVAPGAPAAALTEVLGKSRRYVTRYSIIHETSEPDVSYTIDIDAEVNIDDLKSAIANSSGSGSSVQTIEVWVAGIRRAKDLRSVADLLRHQSAVRAIRQQSYKQQRAVLEVDSTATSEDLAAALQELATDDGVTIVIDNVSPAAVKTTLKLPPRE
jgi:hypothetical protein